MKMKVVPSDRRPGVLVAVTDAGRKGDLPLPVKCLIYTIECLIVQLRPAKLGLTPLLQYSNRGETPFGVRILIAGQHESI